jgi:hypothetical protein
VTLIELSFLVFVLSGLVSGVVNGLQYGIKGALIGGIAGAGVGFLCHTALWGLLLVFIKLQEHASPSYPVCRNGCCHSDDYQHLGFTGELTTLDEHLQRKAEGIVVCCQCGVKYLFSKKRRKFLEILPDGSLCPYMYYKPFRKWKLDDI